MMYRRVDFPFAHEAWRRLTVGLARVQAPAAADPLADLLEEVERAAVALDEERRRLHALVAAANPLQPSLPGLEG